MAKTMQEYHTNDPFPVGYHTLHSNVSLNFQMNRVFNWVGDATMLEEMRRLSERVTGYHQYVDEFLVLAESRLTKDDALVAANYLRAAEFFMFTDDSRKKTTRQRFVELSRELHKIPATSYHLVSYGNGNMSAYVFEVDHPKETLVIFGGFDSYLEEWFPLILFLRDKGYNVVAFEGPGQGGALEEFGLKMTHEWENPVSAILDYFNLENITLIGISLGGGLAIRAAAYEPRITHVVCYDILPDFLGVALHTMPPAIRSLVRMLIRIQARPILNWCFTHLVMPRSLLVEWGIKQGMHVMGATTPFDLFKKISQYHTKTVSHLVRQDVLLCAGSEDHYVPINQLYLQLRLLTNAKSVTVRLFTHEEHAQSHCQIGNLGLSLTTITNWIEQQQTKEQNS